MLDLSRSRAVLMATATYSDPFYPPVPAAAHSLAAMRRVLVAPELCGWPDDGGHIRELYDLARPDLVMRALRSAMADVTDVLLLYVVGHGVLHARGSVYLALPETEHDGLNGSAVPFEWVRELLLDHPARLKILILDCCYSGQVIEALSARDGAAIADGTAIQGVHTLTASDYAAHVPDRAGATTSFTGQLVELIGQGIPDGPPDLTLQDLFPVLTRRLVEAGLPAPNQRNTGSAAGFPFTRNAAVGEPASPPLPPEPLPPTLLTADPAPAGAEIRPGKPERRFLQLVIGWSVLVGLNTPIIVSVWHSLWAWVFAAGNEVLTLLAAGSAALRQRARRSGHQVQIDDDGVQVTVMNVGNTVLAMIGFSPYERIPWSDIDAVIVDSPPVRKLHVEGREKVAVALLSAQMNVNGGGYDQYRPDWKRRCTVWVQLRPGVAAPDDELFRRVHVGLTQRFALLEVRGLNAHRWVRDTVVRHARGRVAVIAAPDIDAPR